MPAPFLVFSWHQPFLPQLKAHLDRAHPDPETVPLLITPNFRPWKYLQTLYTAENRSRLLPRVLPYRDLVALWHAAVTPSAPETASALDRVWLLHGAAGAVSPSPDAFDDGEKEPPNLLAGMSLDAFYPWGDHIASLIDELLGCGIMPENIPDAKGQVPPAAARMLASLRDLDSVYLQALEARNLTTPGLMAYEVADSLKKRGIPAFVRPSEQRPVYILAAHEPDVVMKRIFRVLHGAGAVVCLHTDPGVAGNGPVHWACEAHSKWVAEWGCGAEAAGTDPGEDTAFERCDFFAGYDLHSQLQALHQDLNALAEKPGADGNAAVVLSDPSLLMPVLHHVPEGLRPSLNIAMGLPIAQPSACRLLEACLALQASRDPMGRCHWRELLACVDIPCLGFLSGPDGASLQPALRRMRSQILHGLRYVDPRRDVLTGEAFDGRQEEMEALEGLVKVLVDGFAGLDSLGALADALQGLCDHFRERGERLRKDSPMDMEALFRVEHDVIPALRRSLMADETLSLTTLTNIFTQLCAGVSIAFEPGPSLDRPGLQILSLAETALLSFDTVYLPDATDDRLPGTGRHDPLLPDSLRALLGLPLLAQTERATAWTALRLTRSSGRSRFYWQEGVSRSHLFDGKKTRSRYAEEYIWQRERKERHLLGAGEPPLRQAACVLHPRQPAPRAIDIRDGALEAMRAVLDGRLSPSLIDDYLHCPLAFGLKRLARLREMDTVNESDDPLGVGTFVHHVLEIFHGSHLGDSLRDRKAAAKEIGELFDRELEAPSCLLVNTLPPDSLAFLREAGKSKLKTYIEAQPGNINPILLEHDLGCQVVWGGRTFELMGKVDRVDRRASGLVILDYKTSVRLPAVSRTLFEDEDFFAMAQALRGASTLDERDHTNLDTLFAAVQQKAKSVQLACYVTMGAQENAHAVSARDRTTLDWPGGPIEDAAFVHLSNTGEEVSFFPRNKKLDKDDGAFAAKKALALSRCPDLAAVVLLHMSHCRTLPQRHDDMLCSRCPYAQICAS